MKNIRNLIATFALAGIILVGVSTTNAGFLASDYAGGTNTNTQPCTQRVELRINSGFLVSDFTGVIVNGFATFYTNTRIRMNCGLLMSD